MDRVPGRRIEIRSWRQEIENARDHFYCDHCGAQIWGCYTRKVIRYVSENVRYGSCLLVERKCHDCM